MTVQCYDKVLKQWHSFISKEDKQRRYNLSDFSATCLIAGDVFFVPLASIFESLRSINVTNSFRKCEKNRARVGKKRPAGHFK